MATCSHADRIIPLLHDNELQNPLRREMVAHMATCVICARAFSLLEREQELVSQAIEERVESIDFSNFWQAVEVRLADPPLSWPARLRLWYESWRFVWAFPRPVWAVATLLLFSLGLFSLYRNGGALLDINSLLLALNLKATPQQRSPLPVPEPPSDTRIARSDNQPDSSPIQRVDIRDKDNEAEIQSIYTSGAGEVMIHVRHDRESNITVISLGDGASEYPQ